MDANDFQNKMKELERLIRLHKLVENEIRIVSGAYEGSVRFIGVCDEEERSLCFDDLSRIMLIKAVNVSLEPIRIDLARLVENNLSHIRNEIITEGVVIPSVFPIIAPIRFTTELAPVEEKGESDVVDTGGEGA